MKRSTLKLTLLQKMASLYVFLKVFLHAPAPVNEMREMNASKVQRKKLNKSYN